MRPRKTILCVDDNEVVLSLRRMVLEAHGYRVQTAMSGSEAMMIFERERPYLVLADLIMPGMSGDDLAVRLKAIDADVPVVVYSAATKNAETALNADAFLPKGTNPAEMLYQIKLLAARKRGPRKKDSVHRMAARSSAHAEILRRSA
jgi:CheY-like chemotaxis protein